MIWSNWQKAIGRSAALTLLLWSGLAWTQTSPLRPTGASERIMVVHDGGKSIRCKVNETWQLPDKRMAHLLQSVETGDLVTIVDDPAAMNKNEPFDPRKMPKRIYLWGPGKTVSPEGAPLPPLRDASSLASKNDSPRPSGPIVVNQTGNDKAQDIVFGPPPGLQEPRGKTTLFPPLKSKSDPPKSDSRVTDFGKEPKGKPESIAPPKSAGAPTRPSMAMQTPCDDPAPSCDMCGPVICNRPCAFPRLRNILARFRGDPDCVPESRRQPNLASLVRPPFGIKHEHGSKVISAPPQALDLGVSVPYSTTTLEFPVAPKTQPDPRIVESAPPHPGAQGRMPFGGLFSSMRSNKPSPPVGQPGQEFPGPLEVSGSPFTPAPQPQAGMFEQGPPLHSPLTPESSPRAITLNQGPTPRVPIAPDIHEQGSSLVLPSRINTPPTAIPTAQASTPPAPPSKWHLGRIFGDTKKPSTPPTPAVVPNPGAVAQRTPPALPNTAVMPNPPGVLPTAPGQAANVNPPLPLGFPGQAPVANVPANVGPNITHGITATPLANRGNEGNPPAPVGDPKTAKTEANAGAKKSWKPGDRMQAWFKPAPDAPKPAETTKPSEALANPFAKVGPAGTPKADDKGAQKPIENRVAQAPKVPFSTAMSTSPLPNTPRPEIKKPEPSPLAISATRPTEEKTAIQPPPMPGSNVAKVLPAPPPEFREMWGQGPTAIAPPGKSVLDQAIRPAEIVKLPAPLERRNDPLMNPERITPVSATAPAIQPPADARPPVEQKMLPAPEDVKIGPPPSDPTFPLNSQSIHASRSGLQGPVVYYPVPVVTVPLPNNPPAPPPPQLPSPPQHTQYVNAFSPPPMPKSAQPNPAAQGMPGAFAGPLMPPQMTHQQMMQQQQQMYAQQQQQMFAQQQMQLMGQPMMPYMTPTNPMMAQGTPYRAPMPSAGPMSNYGRNYSGPLPPNPMMQAGYGQSPYPQMAPMAHGYGMMPQQQIQPMSYQQPMLQPSSAQQLDQVLRVLRESPYPAQREWAAQSLTSFDWRMHPQVVPSLLQAATHDPAASVRAGSVSCLGRIGAAVEPVFGTLQSMRNDIDPRVRQEVEQALLRLGQMPMMPQ